MFAHVKDNVVTKQSGRPKWLNSQGQQITDDAVFIAEGIYPIVDAPPTIDRERQDIERNPMEQWTVNADHVAITYTVFDKSLARVRAEKLAVVEETHTSTLDNGFTYDFGTKTATLPDGTTEPAGVRTLQTRSQDRERWQATMQVAQQYIMAGAPSEPMRPFRTEDNASIPMTAQDVADCLNAMQAFFGQALDALWAHKDAIRALTTVDDVVAYDITTLWP